MILGLFPELFSSGGIQRISQDVCAVLQEMADNLGQPCCLFSLNDPEGMHQMEVAGRRFNFRGFGRKKGRFVRAVLSKIFKSRLVYIAHPNFAPLGLLCKSLNPRLRYVVTAYGVEVWNPMPKLNRMGLKSAHALTSISDFTARKMVKMQGVNPNKIAVIPCIIREDLLNANGHGTQPDANSRKVLLTVGRLAASERLKGLDEVILSLHRVAREVPETVYMIVGDGDDRKRLEDLVKEHDLSDRVIFTGVVSDEELIGFYKRCDVFLMPSRQEGFGIVFLEAMAFEKPVIGGNHGGTPEVIIDNETGFLVEHGDINALADRIIRLLRDGELCKRMGEAGRRRVEENYTFDPFRKRLISFLSQVQAQ
jgi:glycosyltransferase involved in cell wall biosynthesis